MKWWPKKDRFAPNMLRAHAKAMGSFFVIEGGQQPIPPPPPPPPSAFLIQNEDPYILLNDGGRIIIQ